MAREISVNIPDFIRENFRWIGAHSKTHREVSCFPVELDLSLPVMSVVCAENVQVWHRPRLISIGLRRVALYICVSIDLRIDFTIYWQLTWRCHGDVKSSKIECRRQL